MIGLTTPSCGKRSIACLESSQRWCWFLGSQGAGGGGGKNRRDVCEERSSQLNEWLVCFFAVFSGELFVCFFGWKTPRSEFFGGLDKDLILKNTCKTQKWPKRVSEILVWGTFWVLFLVLMAVFVSMFWILLVLCVCILQSEWQDSFCLMKGRLLNQPALVDMS